MKQCKPDSFKQTAYQEDKYCGRKKGKKRSPNQKVQRNQKCRNKYNKGHKKTRFIDKFVLIN